MGRFLVCTTPFVGHVTAMTPVVARLVERGNEVRWYTGSKFRETVETTGATYIPMTTPTDFDDQRLGATFPEWNRLSGLSALKFMIKHICTDSAVGQVRDIQEITRDFPADVVLSETTFLGSRWAHELGGPPWAILNSLPLPISSRDTAPFGLGFPPPRSIPGRLRARLLYTLISRGVFRDVERYTKKVRAGVGLPPTGTYVMDNMVSPYLYLQGTVESFEYPRSDLPPQVHFVGPVIPPVAADFQPPTWWKDLEGERRVVHVTQGTLTTDAGQLLEPTIEALADEDMLVVATTGGNPVESVAIDPMPDNVRIEPFIPHGHLLPHVDVMVTNGGYNGVHMALSHGVPLVAGGTTEDKPEVCARIAWTGVGINLGTDRPGKRAISQAVHRIFTEISFQLRAADLSREIAGHNPPDEAAALLEELARTGEPVLRNQVCERP